MRNHQPIIASILLVACYCLPAGAVTRKQASLKKTHSDGTQVSRVALEQKYGDVALAFEPNQGQAPADVRFVSRALGMTVLLRDTEATFIAAAGSKRPTQVHMRFAGASFANPPYALDEQAGISNYINGSTPEQWHTEIPNFGRVRYSGVYPGIDLVLYGNHRHLEHDFVVAPGADYRKIAVELEGASHIQIGENGELQVETDGGNFLFHAPEVYQYHGARKVVVSGRYKLVAANEFSFQIDGFDRSLPLVIDPVLSYSTYLAGSAFDGGTGITIDSNGSAYVTGFTTSIDFPVSHPEQGTCSNVCSWADTFVTKLNPAGTALVYSTFVGGSNDDRATGIAVDALGNASVSGTTTSLDFPQKNGLSVIINSNSSHGFVFSLNPAGSALNFSSFLSGEGSDTASAVAADSAGNVYVAGYTSSMLFPLTPGHQIGPLPSSNLPDLFLTKFSRTGQLVFSSLIGGSAISFPGTFIQPTPIGLAVDAAGEAVISGAAADGFPTTAGAYQATYPGIVNQTLCAFLTKLTADGSAILYGTYLGVTNASGGSSANALALDASGNVYVTGTAYSSDFPTTPGSFQPTALGGPR